MTAEALARPLGEPTRRDWIAVLSAMLGAFMAVLDIQITNSSLKDIQGALAATLEEGSWISTSYLVAEIIMIPMTAWLVQLLSARRLAVMISVGFLVSSLLCSFAWNLESMIVFRAMQGFHRRRADSAGVHPGPGQVAGTPPSEGHGAVRHHRHLRALHRTDPGRLADGKLRLGIHLLYQRAAGPVDDRRAALRPGEKAPHWELLKSTDYAGIVTLGIGLGCLQVFLEEGHRKDWLGRN